MVLRTILLILASLLIAAHFLREGSYALVTLCLLSPLLLTIRRRWVLYVLQLLAYAAAVIWLSTMTQLVRERLATGRDWHRLAAILGGVALFTALAGALLNSAAVKARYPSKRGVPAAEQQ